MEERDKTSGINISALPVGVVLLLLVVLVAFSPGTGRTETPDQGMLQIERYSELWGYNDHINRTLKCEILGTEEDPAEYFGIPIELRPCREDPADRTAGFLESNDIYAFVTCLTVENNRYCCAEVSTEKTRAFEEWKTRCT